MINFRFHLVSLTAVFLALALGVLMGSTVIERGIVDTLNNRIEAVNRRAEAAEVENSRLTREVDRRDDVATATTPLLVAGRLTDVPVVLVAVRGADEDQVGRLLEMLRQAGAAITGPLWLTSRWTLADRDDDLAALAASADVSTTGSVGSVRRDALEALAAGLRAPGPSDILDRLRDARFIDLPGGDPITIAPDARFVMVSDAQADVANDALAIPLSEELVEDGGAVVVAAESLRTVDGSEVRTSFVGPLRADAAFSGLLTTVDDLDALAGRLAVILTLESPAERRGHYGVGERAERLLPDFAPA